MAAVRFSMVAVLHTIRLCVDDRLEAGSSVRGGPMSVQPSLCGTHAGIDPASPAVVEASVLIYLSVYLSRSLSQ